MKVAVLLYGQPRDYKRGHTNIMEFIRKQENCTFDFFYHSWKLNENEVYKTSPWRSFDKNTLIYKEKNMDEIKELYNPISFEIENQNLKFNPNIYKNTIAFNNTHGKIFDNINNNLFNLYSKYRSRTILYEYLKKINNKEYYDFVICVRFDVSTIPEIILDEKNKEFVFVSNIHLPRKVFPDNFIISPIPIFLNWFNFFDNFKLLLNDLYVLDYFNDSNERFCINAEEIILASYIHHFKNNDKIRYFEGNI